MAALVFSMLLGLLGYQMILRPMLAFNRKRDAEQFEKSLTHFKTLMVRRYYPAVEDMSLNEIQEVFDVDDAYDRISLRLAADQLDF